MAEPEPYPGGAVPGRETEGRVSADPEAWQNNRDRMEGDEEPLHNERRLTWAERYGVAYNVDPDTIGK
jgi:hypothetical protein